MKAKFYGRVHDGQFALVPFTRWKAAEDERKAAQMFVDNASEGVQEISILENGEVEVREKGKSLKTYQDEDALLVSLAVKGVTRG